MRTSLRRPAIASLTASLLAACAVGPDYRVPEASAAGTYTEKPQPVQTEAAPVPGGDAQRFEQGTGLAFVEALAWMMRCQRIRCSGQHTVA